jgi:hypothetical protein
MCVCFSYFHLFGSLTRAPALRIGGAGHHEERARTRVRPPPEGQRGRGSHGRRT